METKLIATLEAIPTSEPKFEKERGGWLTYRRRANIDVNVGNTSAAISCFTDRDWDSDRKEYISTHSTNINEVAKFRSLIDVGIKIDVTKVLELYVKRLEEEEAAEAETKKKRDDEWWATHWIHDAYVQANDTVKNDGLDVKVSKPERPLFLENIGLNIEYKNFNTTLSKKINGLIACYQFAHPCTDNKKKTFKAIDSAIRGFVALIDKHIQTLAANEKAKKLQAETREEVRLRLEKTLGFEVQMEETIEPSPSWRDRRKGNFVRRFRYFTTIERIDWSYYEENNKKKFKVVIDVHNNSQGIESYTIFGMQGLSANQVKNLRKVLIGEMGY